MYTRQRTKSFHAVRGKKRILWPEPTHSETESLLTVNRWIPARDIIDWSIPTTPISQRKRPLAEATLRRIEHGIKRYWGEWAEPFLGVLRGASTSRKIDLPLPTVTTSGAHYSLIKPLLMEYYGCGQVKPVSRPVGTVTTKDRFALLNPGTRFDIGFRMLQPHELAAAQGFPADYWFSGNKAEQVKQIGNAVPCGLAEALCSAGIIA